MKRFSILFTVMGVVACASGSLQAQTDQQKAQDSAAAWASRVNVAGAIARANNAYLSDSGGTMYGTLDLNNQNVTNANTITAKTTLTLASAAANNININPGTGASVQVGTGMNVTGSLVVGGTTTTGHVITTGAIGAATNDGANITAASVTGTDEAGTITITKANTATEGTATFAFGTTYGTAPTVILTPANLAAQSGQHIVGYFVTSTATNFTFHAIDDGNTVTNAQYNYFVIH